MLTILLNLDAYSCLGALAFCFVPASLHHFIELQNKTKNCLRHRVGERLLRSNPVEYPNCFHILEVSKVATETSSKLLGNSPSASKKFAGSLDVWGGPP